MATTGSVYVDASLQDLKGNVVAIGRVKVGQNATIEAQDLGLRMIRSIVFNPWMPISAQYRFVPGSIGSLTAKEYKRGYMVMQGSIGSLNQLNNYVKVSAVRTQTFGSLTTGRTGYKGTTGFYIGTQAGSTRASYFAAGM